MWRIVWDLFHVSNIILLGTSVTQNIFLSHVLSWINLLTLCLIMHRYSSEANSMEHKCTCCKERKTQLRQINLKCLNGSAVDYSYTYVESCDCFENICKNQTLSIGPYSRAKHIPSTANYSADKGNVISSRREKSPNSANEAAKGKAEGNLEKYLQEQQPKERKQRQRQRRNVK